MAIEKHNITKHIVTVEIGGRNIVLETGWLAKQAAGAVLVREENSAVFVAVTTAAPRPGIDFFPMTVEYKEKTSAAGKFPGGFFKREGRPSTKEVLTMRMTDRPLRPQFKEGYNDEVQINGMAMSADPNLDPDMLMINGSSAAVMLAGLPFDGPIGAVRMGRRDGKFIVNPDYETVDNGDLNMVVAGTKQGISMVEAGAHELSEDQIVEALELAHKAIIKLCDAQLELVKKAGVKPKEFKAPEGPPEALVKEIKAKHWNEFLEKIRIKAKHERSNALSELKKKALEAYAVGPDADDAAKLRYKHAAQVVGDFKYDATRHIILTENKRIDGRNLDEVRDITIEMSPFPRNHGSVTFTRGETQAFVTCTLGTAQDTQLIDGLRESREESFLLHYNFPPFCTGEAKPIRGTSRRELGHGALAERSIRGMLPKENEFPYTIRIVSDILESNGSSSMASVCGATLAAFDAGVPLKKAVAGVAMGLVSEGDKHAVLTDILGDEDHVGDMDFKVCGTADGITALQMDIKVKNLTADLMRKALAQAKAARLHILGKMHEAMPAPRPQISKWAPRFEIIKIDQELIGSVIGPGGKVIRGMQDEFKTTITVEEDGTIKIFGEDGVKVLANKERIRLMTEKPEIGQRFKGKVGSMREFGAFVEFNGALEALIHVSELSDGYVEKPEDVVKVGDEIEFEVINVDPTGKIKGSRKAVLLKDRGEEYKAPAPRAGGRDRGRGGDRGGRGGGRDRERGPRRERAPRE
ncbi:MAG: polyribonucleotide nucleotidyltransferase [Planctomycetes bacterium]|nr:polyribonucleotide nucleotidyltransferase [Planctomycetota bacterium]MCW8136183.1 polyribonucleotide nucleotidyltransferase [Planctomycetota bacterium]